MLGFVCFEIYESLFFKKFQNTELGQYYTCQKGVKYYELCFCHYPVDMQRCFNIDIGWRQRLDIHININCTVVLFLFLINNTLYWVKT